ncbi:MAG: type II toxin-antitoxin system prevent-host-death family antitoxin [Chloroflexi bacterium]|nr:type II toxin-antitoxin system prevent-host-death family antitoxin [Chloroflexota bacterium]MBU1660107.1 type II toxin-antitoxin system prevent-host-death family antitoxin [Chloroflexota bacterium]
METLNTAEAKSRFSELLSRTSAGERFIIQRRERPVAALINVEELSQMERASQTARRLAEALGQSGDLLNQIDSGQVHSAMAVFGLWSDEPDLDTLTEKIIANRQNQSERSEIDL